MEINKNEDFVFATSNQNKVKELKKILSDQKFKIFTLKEIGFNEEIAETGSTLEENSLIKAKHINQLGYKMVISEDTGLEIDALNGAPGVYSARFAGEEKSASSNIEKVLFLLGGTNSRSARFRTIITLITSGSQKQFVGVCEGKISLKTKGDGGFGYDPIFIPIGYEKTFAELDQNIKNKISHRKKSLDKLTQFINSNICLK